MSNEYEEFMDSNKNKKESGMKINEQLIETYAHETHLVHQSMWNNAVHLLILFIALLFAPISGAIKIVIYTSITAIVGAIESNAKKHQTENVRTNIYLRALFYLQRDKEVSVANISEIEEFDELNLKDPLEVHPQYKYTTAKKFMLIFSWLVSVTILGVTGIM